MIKSDKILWESSLFFISNGHTAQIHIMCVQSMQTIRCRQYDGVIEENTARPRKNANGFKKTFCRKVLPKQPLKFQAFCQKSKTVNRTAGCILGVFSKNTRWCFENTLLEHEQQPNCHETCLICILAGALGDNEIH